MLDIPESVKLLFVRDSIRKNFRAVFDSGLVVTNSDITWNSLRFRESVCSADSVTFGAAEASILEFETVGVRNMLGEWFTADIEIDASSLPEELQTERDDLDFPVYPVPLGRFVVTACPRNHEAMTKRKVTAMNDLGSAEAFTSGVINQILPNPLMLPAKFNPSMELSISGLLRSLNFFPQPAEPTGVLASYRVTQWLATKIGYPHIADGNTNRYLWYQDAQTGGLKQVVVSSYQPAITVYSSDIVTIPANSEYYCEFPDSPDDADESRIASELAVKLWEAYGGYRLAIHNVSPYIVIGADDPIFIDFLTTWVRNERFFSPSFKISGADPISPPDQYYPLPRVAVPSSSVSISYTWTACAYAFGVGRNVPPTVYAVSQEFLAAHQTMEMSVVYYSGGESLFDSTVIKLTPEITPYRGAYVAYMFPAPSSQIATGAVELQGAFGCFRRSGAGRYLNHLSPLPSIRLQPGQYERAWWDEFELAPIGSIAYKIGSDDCIYVFGEGSSQYVFQGSSIFDKIDDFTPEQAQELFDLALVPALQNLTFTPAEITAMGLPYLEAGDCIELEANDGTVIKTYVLERELRGTQHLTDHITADGITISEVNV